MEAYVNHFKRKQAKIDRKEQNQLISCPFSFSNDNEVWLTNFYGPTRNCSSLCIL